jgi:hypothetical protein
MHCRVRGDVEEEQVFIPLEGIENKRGVIFSALPWGSSFSGEMIQERCWTSSP